MDRRTFLGTMAAGITVAQSPELLGASLSPGAPTPAPSWLSTEPLIIVGNWDSIPIFQRRHGGEPVAWQADYSKELTDESVRKLKELGVSLAILHFYKGFGLEAEKEHMQDSRGLATRLHAAGIRVGLYVGSTIAYETFLLEVPQAQEWFVPDYLGKPVFYDDQTFRKRVYFMHPGYREYMKRVLRIGVEDFKADEIDFDNTSMQAKPEIFQHPLAAEDFRNYLRTRYSAEELSKRFGFSDLKYVLPPKYGRPLTTIDDPMFQEWADFRCHQLASYYAEMAELIRGLNPHTAIGTNPHSGISGQNTIWLQGVDYPTLLPHMDIPWTEEGNVAEVTKDGILVSRIRTYKMAAVLGKRILTYTAGGGGGGELTMGESMAFNRQTLGQVGSILSSDELPASQKNYIRFFRDRFDYYREVENLADVALLYTHASMGFNNDGPASSFMLFSQVLIQGRVLFDIIFDDHLKDLSKYRVLVLADQECLSDEQMGYIRKFVEGGGGLVATELTSLYTPWRLRRRTFGLLDLFQVEPPRGIGVVTRARAARVRKDEVLVHEPVRNRVGQGRVAYIWQVKPAIEKPASEPMTSQYWKLPLNALELLEAVKWTAGEKLSLEVAAPSTQNLAVEVTKQDNRRLVHLLNYDRGHPRVAGIEVKLDIPEGKHLTEVKVLSPDRDGERIVQHTETGKQVHFRVPELETYNLIVIQWE